VAISRGGIPLLAEEGWRDSLIEAVAPGAKREPDRAKPQLMVSSAKSMGCRSWPLLRLRAIVLALRARLRRLGGFAAFFW